MEQPIVDLELELLEHLKITGLDLLENPEELELEVLKLSNQYGHATEKLLEILDLFLSTGKEENNLDL